MSQRTKIDHSIGQSASHVEFKREIVNPFRVFLVIVLLSSDPSPNHVVLHSVRKRIVIVVFCRHHAVFHQGEM